ncbi:17407_t:CDS:1, partial [Cetraspora pellucida]
TIANDFTFYASLRASVIVENDQTTNNNKVLQDVDLTSENINVIKDAPTVDSSDCAMIW